MDENNYQSWVSTVEAAAHNPKVAPSTVVHELDRLAEHLVGENAPEAQQVKSQVQRLITELDSGGHDVELYSDRYCDGGR